MGTLRIAGAAAGITILAALGGCAATDLTSDAGLSLAAVDLELPDTVEVIPTAAGDPPLVVPVAYAGATPQGAAASGGLQALAAAPAADTETPQAPQAAQPPAAAQDVAEQATQGEAPAAQRPTSLLAAVKQDDAQDDVTGSIAAADARPQMVQVSGLQIAALPATEAQGADRGVFGPPRRVEARSAELDRLIEQYAAYYDVPVALVRRVVDRESTFNPAARNGPYWGLMQIRHDTARTMGYRGSADGLLDAETNLRYAVKYLRGAYITAGGNHDRAVRHYASGYYYHARDKGLLEVTGLR